MKKVIYLCAGNGNIDLPGFDIKYNDKFSKADGIVHMSQKKRQGSGGVNLVFSRFLSFCY